MSRLASWTAPERSGRDGSILPLPLPEGTWMSGAELERAEEADVARGNVTGYGPTWL